MPRINVPVEWKSTGDDDGTLEGWASTFGNVDLGGDVVMPGAFKDTIGDIRKDGIPLLADHVASTASVLGTIFDAAETDKGLKINARFSAAPSAQDTRTKCVEGHIKSLSIGYEPTGWAYEERDGQQVRLLTSVKLWETSVVVFPMNPEATISRVKSLAAVLTPEQREKLSAELSAAESSPEGDVEAPHAETPAPDGDAPAGGPVTTGWDHYASEAVLAGRDPQARVDAVTRASLSTRLGLAEAATEHTEGV